MPSVQKAKPLRYWPMRQGRQVTSPCGLRDGVWHAGVDFGWEGGSGGKPVYAVQSGTVIYAGPADGYGKDPTGLCGWLVIDSDDSQGSGCLEYGHIRRLPNINVGSKVQAGEQIAVVNPDSNTNGGFAPHLHLSDMPRAYDPNAKQDPMKRLAGALEPPRALEKSVGWCGDPSWLEDVLRKELGDKLQTLPDWQHYGHGDFGNIWGVMIHHTGNAFESAMSIRKGRPDLKGPLANLHIAQDGTVTVVAGGVAWHAGDGSYPGIPTDGANQVVIGIECAWPKNFTAPESEMLKERWPDAEIISMRDSVAAILTKLGYDSSHVIGHKEWAGDENPFHEFRQGPHAKWDPGNLDMNWFRAEVAKAMRGDFKKVEPMKEPESVADYTDHDLLVEIWKSVNKSTATPAFTDRQLLEDLWKTLRPVAKKTAKSK